MDIQLDKDENYVLQADKIQGKWWLELIERKTGMTQTVICDTKQHALKCFKGMTLPEVKTFVDKWGIEPQKVYKANIL